MSRTLMFAAVVAVFVGTTPLHGQTDVDPAAPDLSVEISEALAIGRAGQGGRRAVHTDAIEARLVAGDLAVPRPDDVVELPDGTTLVWEELQAGDDGWLVSPLLRGGYASVEMNATRDGIVLLEAAGHRMVYVNGVPRVGDPYGTGWPMAPIALRQGTNHLLFAVGRGRVRARLATPPATAFFNLRDVTSPDVIVGAPGPVTAGVIVVNATDAWREGLEVETQGAEVDTTVTPVPPIPPRSFRKVPVRVTPREVNGLEEINIELRLREQAATPLHEETLTLRVRRPDQKHKRTFISAIDGSVQYYAVVPAQTTPDDETAPGLVLTLHGASVEAMGQANAYGPKPWCHIVAPTNRRPFGFDWEDWGRIDAIEVLDLASREMEVDPSRVYLTGHSMGGHGTWHLGVTYPDRFAAIAPSAGWISFWSYTGAARYDDQTPVEAVLTRATNGSDTLALSRNYLTHGVYVLHGTRDDNVPVGQARQMREHLAGFHTDFAYYERPGAGHWWGNECVDWPPLFEFLDDHVIPDDAEVNRVEFRTANPGVSASSRWAGILTQQKSMAISAITIDLDRGNRTFTGTTENVARLALEVTHLEPADTPITVELDGTRLESESPPDVLWLERDGEAWTFGDPPSAVGAKGPYRAGPFKDAFRREVTLVYGTQGAPEATAWALAKARFDAETFWYRGNGALEIVADVDFNPDKNRERSVVLYGNADTNAAWDALLGDGSVHVGDGVVRVGDRTITGDDLACLLVRPRPHSIVGSVGAVTGTGLAGMRVTDRLPYFVSGVAYPDVIVIGADTLEKGTAGVRAAGFFGPDWSLESGDFAWSE